MTAPENVLQRRALSVLQPSGTPVFLFTVTAAELLEVADISRISRDEEGQLIGYQRPEVRRHVNQIVEYLDGDSVLFPHAVIVALPSTVKFRQSRGPGTHDGLAAAGTLEIPLPKPGEPRPGWLVDGQQRALALARTKRQDLPVPVTAFIADDIEVQRDQFLRVNNVQPLPRGLVTELLPEVWTSLSPKMSAKRIPSALVDLLNRQPASPFHGLIKRASTPETEKTQAVVTDTVLVSAIEESLNSSAGALYPYRNMATAETDIDGIYRLLLCYWRAVRATFPDAWGLPPTQSRLMHGTGLRAMARLMDRVMLTIDPTHKDAEEAVRRELDKIAQHCRWTTGEWDDLSVAWDALQNIQRDIRMLSNYLVRLYIQESQKARS
ncbi:DGQHR domain-containing protein DpdB [Geodermatophilus sp. FMUSA9-8]|uniref:DGQHR domain-containing protein DpdB n=1 Tax=Geodermatophilus sp. FMUSA9-8 TaxID=3120155 RepID=UPI00300B6F26